MPENTMTTLLVAGAAIAGAAVGSVTTGLMNAHVQAEQQRSQATLESFRFEETDVPVDVLPLKHWLEEMRNLTVLSSEGIKTLAEIARKYPNCYNDLSDRCRPGYVEVVRMVRQELGSGPASAEDIDLILGDKFEAAQRAIQMMNE